MEDFFTREQLYNRLLNESRVLESDRLKGAFQTIDRRDFVTDDYAVEAYEDCALPIGFDQTISQPTTVAFMLELLDLKEGQRVLDVGSGSGWTTALLSAAVGKSGSVLGLERIPELVIFGANNLRKYNPTNASVELRTSHVTGTKELYDRILVSAEANKIPNNFIGLLKTEGILVIPIEGSIVKVLKAKDGHTITKEFPGFSFVPLVE